LYCNFFIFIFFYSIWAPLDIDFSVYSVNAGLAESLKVWCQLQVLLFILSFSVKRHLQSHSYSTIIHIYSPRLFYTFFSSLQKSHLEKPPWDAKPIFELVPAIQQDTACHKQCGSVTFKVFFAYYHIIFAYYYHTF
jgi:hypothetical protein